MKKTSRHTAFLLAFALMLGMGCLVVGCTLSNEDASDVAAESTGAGAESLGTADISAAEALIGEEMTMDEMETALGSSKDFTMSAEGCERGVMQGIFYYDGFTVYSRTYDKGNTFTIVSVSE